MSSSIPSFQGSLLSKKLLQSLPTTAKDLKDSYEIDLKAQEALISEKSWLKNGHPVEDDDVQVDLKLLALLTGDSYISKTPLDGYNQGEGLSHFHRFISTLLGKSEGQPEKFLFLNSQKETLNSLREEFRRALEIGGRIDALRNEGYHASPDKRARLIKGYAEELQNTFRKKPVGWIPFGWKTQNGESHAMMARVDMDSGSVTLVNTGGGVENHPGIRCVVEDKLTGKIKEEYKVQQFLEITNVDKQRLNHLDFFKYLIELQVTGTWHGLLEIDEKNIYQTLPNYLKGEPAPVVDPYVHPEAFKKPQRSGTCAIKCVSSTIYSVMTGILDGNYSQSKEKIDCFKKIKFLWQTQALVNYSRQNLYSGSLLAPSEIGLVKDIVENLGRAADKLLKDGLLAKADLEEIHATFMDVGRRLDDMKSQAIRDDKSSPISCDLRLSPGPYHDHDIGSVEAPSRIQGEERLWDPKSEAAKVQSTEEVFVEFVKNGLQGDFHIESNDPNAFKKITELHAKINNVYDYVYKNHNKGYHDSELREIAKQQLLNKLTHLISQLPIPAEKDSFWDTVPTEDVTKYMREFYSLKVLLQNINFLTEIRHDAEITAMHYILFAINLQLARRLPETKLNGFNVNYHDLVYEMKSPSFIIQDPTIQKKLHSALLYLNPEFKLEQLVENKKSSLGKESKALFAFKQDQGDELIKLGNMEVKEDEVKENETLVYYKKFLENKEIKDELRKRSRILDKRIEYTPQGAEIVTEFYRPVTEKDSALKHLEALFNEPSRGEPFLPESVRLLQSSAILNLQNHYISRLCTGGGFGISSGYTGRISEHLFSTRASVNLKAKSIQVQFDQTSVELNGFIKKADIQDCKLNKRNEFDLKDRIKQNTYVVRQAPVFDLNIDDSRELQMIGVDPYGAVARALSFAKRHVPLIKNTHFQDLLSLHLFSYGRLLYQLQAQPAFASKMGEFFIEAIKHYKQEGDLKICLFLANLGNDLKVFITKAGYEDKMPNFREIVRKELLPQFEENWSDKKEIFETLMCFYKKTEVDDLKQKPLLSQIAEDLIGYKIAKRMAGSGRMNNNEADLIQKRFQSTVENNFEYLGESNPDEGLSNYQTILNNLVRLVVPLSQENSDWVKISDTLYENKNINTTVDIEAGLVTDTKQGNIEVLPQVILDDVIFKKIFKQQVVSCKVQAIHDKKTGKKVGEIYNVNGAEGEELVIRAGNHFANLSFEKGNEQYLADLGRLVDDIPTIFKDEELCIWICRDNPPHLIARKNGEKIFTAQLESAKNSTPFGSVNEAFKVTQIEKIDAQGRGLKLVPFSSMGKLQGVLAPIETSPEYIECWVTQDANALAEVKCPRLGLNFTAKGQDFDKRLVCQQHPGYYLIKNLDLPLLTGLPHLTLENLEGKRKVLLPQAPIQAAFQKESVVRTLKQKIDFDDPLSWVEFELDEGDLRAGGVESRLFHVYLLAASGDYEKAFEMLNKIVSLKRFKDNEKTVIKWLTVTLTKDSHPASKAILLHLISKVEENRLKYPLPIGQKDESDFDLDVIAPAYRVYVANNSNVPRYQLNEKQEKFIIDLLEAAFQKQEDELLKKGDINFFVRGVISHAVHNEKKALMGRRAQYVKTDVGTLGIDLVKWKPDINLSDPDSLFKDMNASTGADGLREEFERYGYDRDLPNDDTLFSSLIQDEGFFQHNFVILYHIARLGSNEQREALKRMLEINSHLASESMRVLKKV